MDEQVEVLRRLWMNEVVSLDGDFHSIHGAGLNPLPIQKPIPIWMGCRPNSPALKRIGRLADGVILQTPPGRDVESLLTSVREFAIDAGRDPDTIGIEATVHVGDMDAQRIRQDIVDFMDLGVSHICFNTMLAGRSEGSTFLSAGLIDVKDQLQALRVAYEIAWDAFPNTS